MKPISRVGWGGFDRPTGISTALAQFNKDITASPVPFRISEEQRGLELMYSFTPQTRIVGSVYNGINMASGDGRSAEANNDKDGLVYFEHMIDDRGSGFTILGYRGVWTQPTGTAVGGVTIPVGSSGSATDFEFWRFGGSFNYVFKSRTEAQFGYIYGNDRYPNTYPLLATGKKVGGKTVEGHAMWAELQQWLPHGSAVFVRGDFIQPDIDRGNWSDDIKQKYTLGGVYSVIDNLRLSAELFSDRTFSSNNSQGRRLDSWGFVGEAMVNF
jgi:hypothetical protein